MDRWRRSLPVLATVIAASALLSPAAHASDGDHAPSVSCAFSSKTGVLTLRLRSLNFLDTLPPFLANEIEKEIKGSHLDPDDLLLPGMASVQRRVDSVTVLPELVGGNGFDEVFQRELGPFPDLFGFGGSGPRACRGQSPTVLNTELVRVVPAKHARLPSAFEIDLTYGRLGPGRTDEGDGGSEIEFETRLAGTVQTRMTRGPDSVEILGGSAGTQIDLDSQVGTPDPDVTADDRSAVAIEGAGGDDALTVSGFPPPPAARVLLGLILSGGQGDDRLTGGAGSETFVVGSGVDRVYGADGPDVVVVFGGGSDRIDCGPGPDIIAIAGSSAPHVHGCEEKMTVRQLINQVFASATVQAQARLYSLLPRRILR